jgi:membrane-associated PAP2 superfamily phosphatase
MCACAECMRHVCVFSVCGLVCVCVRPRAWNVACVRSVLYVFGMCVARVVCGGLTEKATR